MSKPALTYFPIEALSDTPAVFHARARSFLISQSRARRTVIEAEYRSERNDLYVVVTHGDHTLLRTERCAAVAPGGEPEQHSFVPVKVSSLPISIRASRDIRTLAEEYCRRAFACSQPVGNADSAWVAAGLPEDRIGPGSKFLKTYVVVKLGKMPDANAHLPTGCRWVSKKELDHNTVALKVGKQYQVLQRVLGQTRREGKRGHEPREIER